MIVASTHENTNSLPFHSSREKAYAQSDAERGTRIMLQPTTLIVFQV